MTENINIRNIMKTLFILKIIIISGAKMAARVFKLVAASTVAHVHQIEMGAIVNWKIGLAVAF